MLVVVRTYACVVYEYPNYVQLMTYPFELKVACTTSLQDEMVKLAKSGFCPDEPCVFQFTANCFDNNVRQVISSSYFRFRFRFYRAMPCPVSYTHLTLPTILRV